MDEPAPGVAPRQIAFGNAILSEDKIMSDEELLQALGQPGDESAWDLFIERFRALLFAVCFRILRHRQLAEDAVQETWTRIVRSRHTYDGSSPVAAWLARIARNAAIDQQRRAGVRQKHTGGDFTAVEQIGADTEQDFDPRMARLLDRLEEEVPHLSVEQQAVLLLVSSENRARPGLGQATQRATAEALDYRDATGKADHNRVNRLLESAHAALRRRLSQTEDNS